MSSPPPSTSVFAPASNTRLPKKCSPPCASNLAGTWSGTAVDSQGTTLVSWTLQQKDKDVTGYFTNKEEQPKDWTTAGQPMTWTKDCVELMIE